MSKVKFELNRKGVSELMKSSKMQSVLEKYANNAKNKAGPGYEISSYVGKSRVNVSVYTDTEDAREDNLKNNTLLKSVK